MTTLYRSLIADGVLIGTHVFFAAAVLAGYRTGIPSMADLTDEASFAGLWMILKLGLASFVLWRTKGPARWVALAISLLFLDDALEIHEAIGDIVAGLNVFPQFAGVEADDVGELFAAVCIAIPVFGSLWFAFRRASGELRKAIFQFTCFVIALGAVGVGLDFLHAVFENASNTAHPFIEPALATLEDGLELIIATFLLFEATKIRSESLTDLNMLGDEQRLTQ
ncbi:hypothetical protein [Ruegeria arenilitoris]|uniref:hypothetical protein n=1 Tax=Ruegeria arenilitoris TaxID=1173585 RepID=UPI0014803942|nr:hypothetical protein [Ruegeria arenilitoris]